MAKVRFGDYVKETKNKVDQKRNPLKYYVACEHIESECPYLHEKGEFAKGDAGRSFTREFLPGQVLYGCKRTYQKKIAVPDFAGATTNSIFILETKDENKLRQRLIPFILLSSPFTKWSIAKSKGSVNRFVLFSDLEDFEFELPTIQEQDKLVELLWSIEETKESYRKLIDKTDEFIKAQFTKMFGDPLNKTHINSVFTNAVVLNPPKNEVADSKDMEASFVPMEYIGTDGSFKTQRAGKIQEFYRESNYFRDGDILIAKTSNCFEMGRLAIAHDCCNGIGFGTAEIHVVRPIEKRSMGMWVKYLLKDDHIRKHALFQMNGSAGQKRLQPSFFENLKIYLPPLIKQQAFSEFATRAEKSANELRVALANLDALSKKINPFV